MMRTAMKAMALAAALLLVPAGSNATTTTTTVLAARTAFLPSVVVVEQGGEVTFTNVDTSRHTMTSVDGLFDSGSVAAAQSKPVAGVSSLAASTDGYTYVCLFHPEMRGTLMVVAAA